MTIDLDAYFTRIGYAGPRTPNLKLLRDLHARHPMAIPYENLDPYLGRPVKLDLPALEAKLVRRRRGGYCFEQNTLFKAVLDQLGFHTTIMTARVLWMMPPEAPVSPRTHMVLRVDLADGPYIADVGFGGHISTSPYALVPEMVQETPAGTLRLLPFETNMLTLQLGIDGEWRDAYRIILEPQYPIDLELANWFTATHPSSRFVTGLLLARMTATGRISLADRRLIRRTADGGKQEVTIEDATTLERVLREEFGIDTEGMAGLKLPG